MAVSRSPIVTRAYARDVGSGGDSLEGEQRIGVHKPGTLPLGATCKKNLSGLLLGEAVPQGSGQEMEQTRQGGEMGELRAGACVNQPPEQRGPLSARVDQIDNVVDRARVADWSWRASRAGEGLSAIGTSTIPEDDRVSVASHASRLSNLSLASVASSRADAELDKRGRLLEAQRRLVEDELREARDRQAAQEAERKAQRVKEEAERKAQRQKEEVERKAQRQKEEAEREVQMAEREAEREVQMAEREAEFQRQRWKEQAELRRLEMEALHQMNEIESQKDQLKILHLEAQEAAQREEDKVLSQQRTTGRFRSLDEITADIKNLKMPRLDPWAEVRECKYTGGEAYKPVNLKPGKREVKFEKRDKSSWDVPVLEREAPGLPVSEPPIFSGEDPEQFLPFKTAFMEVVVSRFRSYQQRFSFLLKYTSGPAREVVGSCFNPEDHREAYEKAVDLLEETFGSGYALAQQYLAKLRSWPPLRQDNMKASLRRLYLYLLKLNNVKNCRPGEFEQLDNQSELRIVIDKLPSYMAVSWRESVDVAMKRGRYVNFEDLVGFIKDQSRKENLPVFGEISRKRGSPQQQSTRVAAVREEGAPDPQRKVAGKSGINQGWQPKAEQGGSRQNRPLSHRSSNGEKVPNYKQSKRALCRFCEGSSHTADLCFELAKASTEQVREFMKVEKLCFRCLSREHMVRACEEQVRCPECGSRGHCRSLHAYYRHADSLAGSSKQKVESERVAASRMSSRVFSPVVPALVRVRGQTGWIETNVALDSWASSGFMSEDLQSKLGVNGVSSRINLSTLTEVGKNMDARIIRNLEIRRLGTQERVSYPLKPVHVMKVWPFTERDVPDIGTLQQFNSLQQIPWRQSSANIGLLLGGNEPKLVRCNKSVGGEGGEPYASEHLLGWALNGPVRQDKPELQRCCRVCVETPEEGLENMYRQEFLDRDPGGLTESVEDKDWLAKVSASLRFREDGKCEIGLPFRKQEPNLPDNKYATLGGLRGLKRRMSRDPKYKEDYTAFMQKMIDKGHLERVPEKDLESVAGKVWYIPHHGVYHKVKGKLRVVFDCSRRCLGVSLNDELLTGPDLLNKLVGVLLLFRRGQIAVMGDIEQMFLQIKVPPVHSEFMRVWWWPNGDCQLDPEQFRLTSHTFGAVSSPSVANWVVSHVAVRASLGLSPGAVEVLTRCAYMDDVLGSFDNSCQAAQVWKEVAGALSKVGFNLTSLSSTSREVLESFERDHWSDSCNLDLETQNQQDRVLGLTWDLKEDSFAIKLGEIDKAFTKRGVLSVIGSVYDPLGLVVPVAVPARRFFQRLCAGNLGWDDNLSEEDLKLWRRWLQDLKLLTSFSVPRWLGRSSAKDQTVELHIFCDGSQDAHAAVAYTCIMQGNEVIKTVLLMAKARQNPISRGALCTIPRIELAAAKLAVGLALKLRAEMPGYFAEERYWSDSMIVLGYLRSTRSRFQRYVENRVNFILAHTPKEAWTYIPSELNPADVASRGCSAAKLLKQPWWVGGPEFLRERPLSEFEEPKEEANLPEVKSLVTLNSRVWQAMDRILCSSGSWLRIRFRVVVFAALAQILRGGDTPRPPFPPELYKQAEAAIWRYVQGVDFPRELEALRTGQKSQLGLWKKLNPFLDEFGVARVGGRLGYASEPYDMKHPVLLSARNKLVQTWIRYLHEVSGHFGSYYLQARVMEEGNVFGLRVYVRQLAKECVVCRRLNGRKEQPLMADLPVQRVTPAQKAFDSVGVDFFGPLEIVRGKSRVKVWGVVFTCLASRAVHLEVADGLDTSSFLNCFRRFVARRGRCSVVYSDNGTNLVGACREMKRQLAEWNRAQVGSDPAAEGVRWHFNPPHSSNFGGVWEREIRTVRRILIAVMKGHGMRATRDVLYTAFCEVEALLNARPLSPVTAEAVSLGPLTPNHVLLIRPHQGVEGEIEVGVAYLNRRWRYAQFLVSMFWNRWRKEYLVYLRERSKWHSTSRNLEEGDLVICEEPNVPRGKWPLGKVARVFASDDGVVRKVIVRMADEKNTKGVMGVREKLRPVNKLVLVMRKMDTEV